MDAQNDLCRVTGNHHEHDEDDHGDEDERHKENQESFEQIRRHIALSIFPPKEKA